MNPPMQLLLIMEQSTPSPKRRLPDVCRARHRGHAQSEAANSRVHPYKRHMRDRILELLESAGLRGMTLHELARAVQKQPHQISGRITELKSDKAVREAGYTREVYGAIGSVLVKT